MTHPCRCALCHNTILPSEEYYSLPGMDQVKHYVHKRCGQVAMRNEMERKAYITPSDAIRKQIHYGIR